MGESNQSSDAEGVPAGLEGQLNEETCPLVQVVGAARSLCVTLELVGGSL